MSQSPSPRAVPSTIELRGAREHNLKGVDLDLPRGRLIVFCGVSGSGKSSVAFDTLYAEGQRRYLESLSSYARQFLGQLDKPAFTSLRGLSPTIAIEQKSGLKNPRSTVGTITELLDHLRVLYARAGDQVCHSCGTPFSRHSAAEIAGALRKLPEGTRFQLLSPQGRGIEGPATELIQRLRKSGFARLRVDDAYVRLDDIDELSPGPHDVDVVVDRLVAGPGVGARVTDSVETALKVGDGHLIADVVGGEALPFSERPECAQCATPIPQLSPQLFSFNHPKGMCPSCNGLGTRLEPDLEKIVPDVSLSPLEGAVEALGATQREDSIAVQWLKALGQAYGFDPHTPWSKLSDEARHIILYGTGEVAVPMRYVSGRGVTDMETPWEGAIPTVLRRLKETRSEAARDIYLRLLTEDTCSLCEGRRLRPEARAVTVAGPDGGLSLPDAMAMSLDDLAAFFLAYGPTGNRAVIARDLLREIRARLGFLIDVGVGYLSLERSGPSLSGGEAQRIRLASQLGSELTGVLYVLDEPSIGLHPRDTARLIATLERLRDGGNTVLVVEHDEGTIRAADYVTDFGPGAGRLGGEVVYAGDFEGLLTCEASRTGAYLSGRAKMPIPPTRRAPTNARLTIAGARAHNLKNLTVDIPLGLMAVVTGVSGAGKSTLIDNILAPALARALHRARQPVGAHDHIKGIERIQKVIRVDQGPIGRSPRSNPATYTGAWDRIRAVFAGTREARLRGYTTKRFSFNSKGGRCEACQGQGTRKIEMHFLADVFVPCDICDGRRFNEATLAVTFREHTIADILALTIDEAYALFRNHRKLANILGTLKEVGLGYLNLGQPATTLSGGESQRMKLARELARPDKGHTLYILDEPTTGLHFDDVARLVSILRRLVEEGHSVLVVEHDIDMVMAADWVIDLGPDGGAAGGMLVAEGPPEAIAKVEASHTGRALRRALGG